MERRATVRKPDLSDLAAREITHLSNGIAKALDRLHGDTDVLDAHVPHGPWELTEWGRALTETSVEAQSARTKR